LTDAAELVKRFEIDKLPVEQRIELIEAIWKSIDARATHVVLPTRAEIALFEKHMDRIFEQDSCEWDEEDLFAFPRDRH
jgi:putative addiction module component (TIGR02574 family)